MPFFSFGRNREAEPFQPSDEFVEALKEFKITAENMQDSICIDPGRFIVYITKNELWATYATAKEFQIPDGAQLVLSRATFIQTVPVHFPGEKDQLAFRRIVGAAIELALSGELQGADEMLDEAEGYVARRAAETSRFWYLQASLLTAALIFLFGVVSELLKWGWPTGDGTWQHLGMATSFGAIGALFSFLHRIRKHNVDPGAGWKAHWGDAILRIILGSIGAFIFAVGIKAKFVMGFLEDITDDNLWLMYIFCVAAGFSERLVPDFLQQVESRALKDPNSPDEVGFRPGVEQPPKPDAAPPVPQPKPEGKPPEPAEETPEPENKPPEPEEAVPKPAADDKAGDGQPEDPDGEGQPDGAESPAPEAEPEKPKD